MADLTFSLPKGMFSFCLCLSVVWLLGCQETVSDVKDAKQSDPSISSFKSDVQPKADKLPEVIKQAQPSYPDGARKAGIEGMVVVKVLVDTLGNVRKAEVVRSIPELDQAAIEAAMKFEFKAATSKEKPVNSWITIPFHFKLSDDK